MATMPDRGRGRPLDPTRIVYGRHPVRECLRGRRQVRELMLTTSARRDLGDAVGAAQERGVVVREIIGEALDEQAGSTDHQGALAVVDPFPYSSLDDLLRPSAGGGPPFVLCLDQVTDPHNLGSIARVADAAGATGLLVPDRRSALVTAAAVKASAGALEHVAIARCRNLADALVEAKGPDLWVYAATEDGTREYTEVDFSGGTMLVLGAEGPGIRPRVLSMCDEQVRIPMQGHVSSLNVSTVAAVLAFEGVRQRGAAGRAAASAS